MFGRASPCSRLTTVPRVCRAASLVWHTYASSGSCHRDTIVRQLLRRCASSATPPAAEVLRAPSVAGDKTPRLPWQTLAPGAAADFASVTAGSKQDGEPTGAARGKAKKISQEKFGAQPVNNDEYGSSPAHCDLSYVSDGSSCGGNNGSHVDDGADPAALAIQPADDSADVSPREVNELQLPEGTTRPTRGQLPTPKRPVLAVIAAFGSKIMRKTYVNIDLGGRAVSIEQHVMTEIVEAFIEQGVDLDTLIHTPRLFAYQSRDVRLALSLLLLDDKPVAPAAVVALLDGSGNSSSSGAAFLSGDSGDVAAAYRPWRCVPSETARRMLAIEMGVTESELNGMHCYRGQDPAAVLDKILLLRQQPEVTATSRDLCLQSNLLAINIERIAVAVVRLRKANVNPATLMQVFTMAQYKRITTSPSKRSIAERHAELAGVFQCDAKSLAATSQSVWPVYTVEVKDAEERISLLATMGVQPRDVLRVPQVLSFSCADLKAAAEQVDGLHAQKRDTLRGDSFKLLNGLVYFADKANMFQLVRSPTGEHRKKTKRKP